MRARGKRRAKEPALRPKRNREFPQGISETCPCLRAGGSALRSRPMKSKFVAFLAGLFVVNSVRADPLAVGAAAPVVSATSHTGDVVNLGELYAKEFVLVYFYPKADTPGCTSQACSLRDAFEQLTDRGVTVIGVSADDVAAQKAFREKYNLPFLLLADTEHKVIDAFGVPMRLGSFASRQAFLIHKGKIVWCDYSASTKEQAADVLAALEELKKAGG
jgi:thioredoxin-dependent peroxiredoxin